MTIIIIIIMTCITVNNNMFHPSDLSPPSRAAYWNAPAYNNMMYPDDPDWDPNWRGPGGGGARRRLKRRNVKSSHRKRHFRRVNKTKRKNTGKK